MEEPQGRGYCVNSFTAVMQEPQGRGYCVNSFTAVMQEQVRREKVMDAKLFLLLESMQDHENDVVAEQHDVY
ncbi:UNVERIFIED_CONTAM: hypothetical protein FKN15_052624 [Acipenser sinensis]